MYSNRIMSEPSLVSLTLRAYHIFRGVVKGCREENSTPTF
jgi:hypothetical protein